MALPSYLMAVMSLDRSHDSSSFDKPVPRQQKSPAKLAQLQVQNRRREYVQRNPSYLSSIEHELDDPVLYERLVKRFQTTAEREAEGKTKGYGRTLEADLVRGETKLSNLQAANGSNGVQQDSTKAGDGGLGTDPWDSQAENKEHGIELWRAFVEERFIHGLDEDFDYDSVDANEDLDIVDRRYEEDAWFDDEEPSWIDTDKSDREMTSPRQGETGVQDF